MLRVAVVGANGFVGSRLVEQWHLEERADVVPVVRRPEAAAGALRFGLDCRVADALDLLAVSVEAGLGFDGAIAKLTEHMDGALAEEFSLTLGEMRIGESRHDALKKLAERSGAPLTTALRCIATLEKEGLIDRVNDRFDRRRMFLALTEKGRGAMSAYFDELHPDTKIL